MDEPETPRRVETVEFAPVRLGATRRHARSPLIVGAWVVVLGAVVAIATVGRPGPTTDARTAVLATQLESPSPAPMTLAPGQAGRLRAGDPVPLAVTIKPVSGGVSVAATVLMRSVTRVSVSVIDAQGERITTRSLAVEDPDGGIRPARAKAFSMLIGLSDAALRDAFLVEVDAYDATGATIGSALHSLYERCGAGRPCNSS